MPSPLPTERPPHSVTGVAPHVEHTVGVRARSHHRPPLLPPLKKEKPPIPTNTAITQESGSAQRT